MSNPTAEKRGKRPSTFDRCFRAADIWVRLRFKELRQDPPTGMDARQEMAHVGYRCGWYAGYERARRDYREGKL